MAPTKQQKAFCVVEYAKTTSVITVQRNFRRQFEVDPPDKNSIKRWPMPTLNGVLVMGTTSSYSVLISRYYVGIYGMHITSQK
jgi:hypothetical protein